MFCLASTQNPTLFLIKIKKKKEGGGAVEVIVFHVSDAYFSLVRLGPVKVSIFLGPNETDYELILFYFLGL